MEFGALVCAACGHNLRTGSKVATPNETVLMTRMHSVEDELTPSERLLMKPSAGLWMIIAILLNVFSVIFGFIVWMVSDHRLAKARGRLMFFVGLTASLVIGGVVLGAFAVKNMGYKKLRDHIEIEKRLRQQPSGVDWAIALALAKGGSRKPEDVFQDLLNHGDPAVEDFAAWALGEIGEPSAAGKLVACLGSRRLSQRQSAAEALQKLGAGAVEALVLEGLESEDEDTRTESRALLKVITDRPFSSDKEWKRWYERYRKRKERDAGS